MPSHDGDPRFESARIRMPVAWPRTQTLDNSPIPPTCQRNASKNNGEDAPALGARVHLPLSPGIARPARLPFQVAAPGVDETPLARRDARATALRLSEAKARAVAARFPDASSSAPTRSPTATAAPIGKPGNRERAIAQLRALSGRTVVFHTGSALRRCRKRPLPGAMVDITSTFRALARRRDRGLPRPRAALRLRGLGEFGGARHRALRPHRRATIPPRSSACR